MWFIQRLNWRGMETREETGNDDRTWVKWLGTGVKGECGASSKRRAEATRKPRLVLSDGSAVTRIKRTDRSNRKQRREGSGQRNRNHAERPQRSVSAEVDLSLSSLIDLHLFAACRALNESQRRYSSRCTFWCLLIATLSFLLEEKLKNEQILDIQQKDFVPRSSTDARQRHLHLLRPLHVHFKHMS